MTEKTWTVIQFIDDGTVEAVPYTWIMGDFSHWPSLAQDKLQNSIRKCEALNTCWPSHRIKIFRNATYEDYMKARAKAKIAEDTSDLNTEVEENLMADKKRKRIQKVLSSSDDSINESILSQPPKIQKFKKKFEKEGALAINADKENRGNYIEPIIELVAAGRSTRNDVVSEPVEMENLTQSGSQEEKLCGGASCKTLKSLVQQGHMLRVLVSDTLSEVKNLRTDLHLINLQKPINQTRNIFNNPEVKFPIEQDEDFNSVEDILRSEEEFNIAIPELSKLGGGSVYDYVKRVFGLIMTDKYAVKYSWLGRKEKRAFKNCNLAKLILKSADATGLPKSHKDIEIAIQNWLRRATDRRHFAQTKKKY